MLTTIHALIACLPQIAYEPTGEQIGHEFAATAAPIDDAQASAIQALTEVRPDLADVMLTDWERNYGLSSVQSGGTLPNEQRTAALLARINQQGNLSRQYIIASALVIGFPSCSITEFEGMSCDAHCDGAVNDDAWVGVWRLDVPAGYTGSVAQLRQLIARRKAAHTIASVNLI